MIYTVGNRLAYNQYFKELKEVEKAAGGSVWKTFDDVATYLSRITHAGQYEIFGVEADWEKDTIDLEGASWNALTKNAKLIKLNNFNDLESADYE